MPREKRLKVYLKNEQLNAALSEMGYKPNKKLRADLLDCLTTAANAQVEADLADVSVFLQGAMKDKAGEPKVKEDEKAE